MPRDDDRQLATARAPLRERRLWPVAAVVLLFLAAALPLILTGVMRGRGASDQIRYHEPTIARGWTDPTTGQPRASFADQWPRIDFSDYLSATTPGYHVVLATAAQISRSRVYLRLVSALFTVGLLGTMAWACSVRFRPIQALACSLPLACSMYVFDSGIYLLPDNAGWWGVLGIILLALRPRFDAWTIVGGGLILLWLVLIRQIHLWAAAPIWTAAWLGSAGQHEQTIPGLLRDVPARLARLVPALLVALPALGLLLYFRDLWGGRLIPPTFEYWYSGRLSWATPAFFLSLLGAGSVFFLPYLFVPIFGVLARRPGRTLGVAALAAAVGFLLAVVPATNPDFEAGRFSGIWRATEMFPVIAGRTSVLIVLLSMFGAVMLSAWAYALPFRSRWIVLSAMTAFVAAQIASPQLWQRYHEPLILMLLAFMACDVGGWRVHDEESGTTPEERAFIRMTETIGPFVLAALLATVTVGKLAASPQAREGPPGPAMIDPTGRHQPPAIPDTQSTPPEQTRQGSKP